MSDQYQRSVLLAATMLLLLPSCKEQYCASDDDCADGRSCNLATNQCYSSDVDAGDAQPDAGDALPDAGDAGDATPCTGHNICTDPEAPVCLSQTCQPCDDPSQCFDKNQDRPLCEGGQCHECNNSTDLCTNIANANCNAGTCEPCQTGSTECQTPFPLLPVCLAGECVQCVTSVDDCTTSAPICDTTTHTCRLCEAHAECDFLTGPGNGICDWDTNTCVASANIIYVDGSGACNSGGQGLVTDPLCEIHEAVDIANASRFIILVADGLYQNITITSVNPLWILGGTGTPTISQAMTGNSMVVIDGTSDVRIENLTIRDAGGAGGGISCNGSANVPAMVLVGNTITTNTGGGVYATDCTVTLEANTITTNPGGGLYLSDSNFTVLNNIVTLNGGAATVYGGVYLDGTPVTARFHSNTIMGNVATAGIAAGIRCTQFFDVTSSIVDGVSEPHLSGTCTPAYSYIGDSTGGGGGNGNINTGANPDPMLDGNYNLLLGSPCIDTGDTVSAPTYDFEGETRDATPDIGADEYLP